MHVFVAAGQGKGRVLCQSELLLHLASRQLGKPCRDKIVMTRVRASPARFVRRSEV